jgi:hypothetical protein
MSDELPGEPASRKVMVVVDEDDYQHLEYADEGRDLLIDPEIQVQQFPVDTDNKLLREMQRNGTLRPGTVLLQSPYDAGRYTPVEDAETTFAVEKYTLFSTGCMMLGATEVRVERIICEEQQGETEVEVGVERTGVRGNVEVENERIDSFRSQLNLRDEFEGGEANVDAAESLMRRTALINHPNLRSLLEMARVKNNQINSRDFHLDLTREVRQRMEIVADLKIPGSLGVTADVERFVEEKLDYSVDVSVQF